MFYTLVIDRCCDYLIVNQRTHHLRFPTYILQSKHERRLIRMMLQNFMFVMEIKTVQLTALLKINNLNVSHFES